MRGYRIITKILTVVAVIIFLAAVIASGFIMWGPCKDKNLNETNCVSEYIEQWAIVWSGFAVSILMGCLVGGIESRYS